MALSGKQKTGQNAMDVGAAAGVDAHADFSKDDHAAQGAFSLIVGRLEIWVF